jgi:lipopolysaccharide/colanic/teichoic acid biosynthesis glycosyltransferase
LRYGEEGATIARMMGAFQRIVKRLFDVLVAGLGLLALSPLLAFLLGVNAVVHGWPPLFVQTRPGLHGRLFKMVKLRTMTNARGPDGALLPDAERLTRFGQFLRRTSLDELPELFNVLKGDMSLVGPRPLMVAYLERYSTEQARRHEVRPGITGWAQVNGRNAQTWEDRLRDDVWYVDHASLGLDLQILWRTVRVVLGAEGITAEGDATMPPFMGTAEPAA